MAIQATAVMHRSVRRRPSSPLVAGVVACALAMGGTWLGWHQLWNHSSGAQCGMAHVACGAFHPAGRPYMIALAKPIGIQATGAPRPHGSLADDETAAAAWTDGGEAEIDYVSGIIETADATTAPSARAVTAGFRQIVAQSGGSFEFAWINGHPAFTAPADPAAPAETIGAFPIAGPGQPAVVTLGVGRRTITLYRYGRHPLHQLIALAATVR